VVGILFVNQRLKNISISWTKVYKKLKNLSDSYSGEVKHWYICCQTDYCWFGLQKKCVFSGCRFSLRPKWRQQEWKRVSDYSLATKARLMIFCTAL